MKLAIMAIALVIGSVQAAQAAIITSFDTSAPGQTAFPVSSTDLINNGSAALQNFSSIDYFASVVDSYGPVSALIDGAGGGITGFIPSPGGVMDIDGAWSFIVNLNTSIAPNGYDIAEIQTFTGHTDDRKSQKFNLWVSLVGDASFQQLGQFEFDFNSPTSGSSRLTIADSTGPLATGVDAIRWEVQMPSSGNASVYREFDVVGVASVPEPPGLAVGTLMCAFGLSRFRRRQK